MATTALPPVLSGLTFGAALTLSGVAAPSIIIDQFRLTNYHMLLAFLSASACSAAIIFVSNTSKYARLGSRKDSSLGWLGKFDGNVIGGALQGVGMGLTGACPGTVLVQLACGGGRGWEVLVGGALGAMVFVRWDQSRKRVSDEKPGQHTVMEKMGWSVGGTVVGYEVALLAVIAAVNGLAPRGRYFLNPAVGGLLIGVAQATSVLVSRKTLGVSSAYEDIGKWVWSVIDGKGGPGAANLLFATGVAAGARVTMSYVPATLDLLRQAGSVSPLAAVTGGFAMIFGARLAGGCTSGHGISGMSTLSVSSFVTVASMFAAGIATALVLQ